MKEIQGKSILVRVSARSTLANKIACSQTLYFLFVDRRARGRKREGVGVGKNICGQAPNKTEASVRDSPGLFGRTFQWIC